MDYNYDPCVDVENLDFSKDEDLKKILQRDKHTRIEGICTEVLFFNDLVKTSFENYSSGWWFFGDKTRYTIIKITFGINELTDLDFFILDYFKTNDFPAYVVSFKQAEKRFYYVEYKPEFKNDINSYWRDNKKIYPLKKKAPPIPSVGTRNETRLNQAIDLLENSNALRQAAIERLFANCYLSSDYHWDIDAFVIYNDKLVAFEVKQKYPTAIGTFGLNVGLANLFKRLRGIDITVVHVILTKPIWDKFFPAIDFYTKEEYIKHCYWIATDFSKEEISLGSLGIAPKATSIFSSSYLKFYNMKISFFHKLKPLMEEDNQILIRFLEGNTTAIKDLNEIPKLR